MRRFMLALAALAALAIPVAVQGAPAHAGLLGTNTYTAPAHQATFQSGSNADGLIVDQGSGGVDAWWDIEGGQVWDQNQKTHNDTNYDCVYAPNNSCQLREHANTYWCVGWSNSANQYVVEHCVTPVPTWQQFRWGSFNCVLGPCEATIYNIYRGHWLYSYGDDTIIGDTSNQSIATEWCPTAVEGCYE
jgi:hypothetical protein